MTERQTLDPVTFEVLKNSFVTVVVEMAEQILRTCHSFVIWARDFSNALCDAEGNTVMQGSQDIAVHVIHPIFDKDEVIAFTQSNGHWANMGGNEPGSFDVGAKMHFGEGLR